MSAQDRPIRSTKQADPASDARPPTPGCEPDAAREPAVDLEHLCGFTGGNPQLESELSALYLSSAGVYLERMAAALKTGGCWRETAHALKGASANLGARRVAALALNAERTPPSAAQLEALGRALEEVRAYFAARAPRHG